jgi:flagellar FliJ protein
MAQMESMIAGLERMVKTLKTEIEAEQVRSGVNDPAQFNYPTIATALIRRRDNAMRTIDMLRRELTELDRVAKQTGEFIIA